MTDRRAFFRFAGLAAAAAGFGFAQGPQTPTAATPAPATLTINGDIPMPLTLTIRGPGGDAARNGFRNRRRRLEGSLRRRSPARSAGEGRRAGIDLIERDRRGRSGISRETTLASRWGWS